MTTAQLVLLGNNLTSFVVVMLCWWLAHAHAGSAYLLRRLLAAGYGVVGVTTFSIAMFRNLVDDQPWLSVAGKVALIFLLGILAARQTMKMRNNAFSN